MAFLSIFDKKCRRCNRCVRECPTNALKIDKGKVRLIEDLCILCGTCYKNCPHNAISISINKNVNEILNLLKKGEKLIACLDPTFPAVLDRGTPGQLVTALKKLGFQEVWESDFAGDLIVQAYKEKLAENKDSYFISSFCPSVVFYIKKFAPELVKQLIPIVSPMIASGIMIKKLRGTKVKVIFIGSCISRMEELNCCKDRNGIDYILTYHDITKILKSKGIKREKQKPSNFDGLQSTAGSILSIAGGLSQCIGFDQDILNLDFITSAGSERVISAIKQYQNGIIKPKFLDLLFCRGCINGPIIDKNISGPDRKNIVVNYLKSKSKEIPSAQNSATDCVNSSDLIRNFKTKEVFLPEPEESEIQAVLEKLNKTYPDQNLDCGACGYNSCRKKAIAVVRGLAEMEMCPHYLLEQCRGFYKRLEKSHKQLKVSHEKLEQAQKQLIQTEKMGSLGQLSAGIAHELNNPLGTITMFAHILQKQFVENKKWKKDIDLIVQEAERAAKIVKDLLNFSRETKVKPGLMNVNAVIEEALSLLSKQSLFFDIEVKKKLDPSTPNSFADPDLLKQVLLNIILNGAQAMEGKGILTLESCSIDYGKTIQISIGDNGKGINPQHLHKLFDPFFTTKEKGTGLGLAIAYGVVSKHKGKIKVRSEVGVGTKFTITLPVLDQNEWMKSEQVSFGMKEQQGGKEVGFKRQDLIG